MRRPSRILACALFLLTRAFPQQAITIHVTVPGDAAPVNPVWNYYGYDEPNYTYTANGRKLIGELSAASPSPAHFRTHNLLTTGDGTAALKWGSTNAYTEDSAGKAIYDWTISDRILDTYVQAGAKPFVEIGFMPKALSTNPEPYVPVWKPGENFDHYYVGWTYPPRDYGKWGELVFQWVRHCAEKYGAAEVASWHWEVWNEPDIGYWHGTPDEYDKLYDYAADAVKRALPAARIGGPATTGPASPKAAAFLTQFLEHCATGKNNATGKTGAPLDFITFHAKGRPEVVAGNVRMGLSQELKDASRGFEIVRSFPKFQHLPIVLSEADPEGCAACSARVYPRNAYRNGTLYPAYTATAIKALLQLAQSSGVNLEGILTWAFEFEGQPYFDGFRTLATNGIDKPVLNVFRMAGLLRGVSAQAESSGAIQAETILQKGVQGNPDVDALAAKSNRTISVLVWNYHDDDLPAAASTVDLEVTGVPSGKVLIHHYRIDETHSNAYTFWKHLGSPVSPLPEQYRQLEDAGQLELEESPRFTTVRDGKLDLQFSLPRQALSLFELSW